MSLRNLGIFTSKDERFIESKLSENYVMQVEGAKQCPQCMSFGVPADKGKKRVACGYCGLQFCWRCLHAWKSANTRDCHCGQCVGACGRHDQALRILREAPPAAHLIAYCKVGGVPSARACPGCGTVTEHAGGCKHMTCHICSTEYCFICLKTKVEHQAGPYDWHHSRPCPVAPVQTVIPGQ